MTNKEIANAFDSLANLMELHEEDGFRIRSYRNAYLTLRKVEQPLENMSETELKNIKGVGAAIAAKIREIVSTGKLPALEKYKAETPEGVVEMLDINGFGPKKVRAVWMDMGIETVGELWYACNENRLVEYKGFGLKTQEDLKNKLAFYLKSRNKLHLDRAEEIANFALVRLAAQLPTARLSVSGELRRRCPVVEQIDMLIGVEGDITDAFDDQMLVLTEQQGERYTALVEQQTPIVIHRCTPSEFGSKLFKTSGSKTFLDAFVAATPGIEFKNLANEQEVFDKAGLPFISPELRETAAVIDQARRGELPELITENDLKGILHVHTTWSDGLHELRDMCLYAQQLGYEYVGITDHSQSAFYANGLKPDRVLAQMEAIDRLNEELAPFRILKGIESDILNDGSLDYEDSLLEKFDFIIASVHSNLKMSREKATDRILRAIENPYTTILGHPTGRLLLSREGYSLDWDAVFEACKKHQVAIELNANPYRLDLDWSLIPQATAMGIRISINPDAHSREGYDDLRYGVSIARKGGLTKEMCFNANPVWV